MTTDAQRMAAFFQSVIYDKPPKDWRKAPTWDDPDDEDFIPEPFRKEFVEAEHPRVEAGSEQGGEFAPKA